MSHALTDVETGSPLWLEHKLTLISNLWFRRVSELLKHWHLTFLVLSSIFASYSLIHFKPIIRFCFPQRSLPDFFRFYPEFVLQFPIFLIALGPLIFAFRTLNPVLSATTTALLTIVFFALNKTLTAYTSGLAVYFAAAVFLLCTYRNSAAFRITGSIIVTVCGLFLSRWISTSIPSSLAALLLSGPAYIFFLRSLTFAVVEQEATGVPFSMKNPSAITYAMSPITFFFMMPFKVSDFSSTSVEKRIMNSISGFTDIIMGLLAFFFCSVVFRETQTIENSSDVSILVLRCFRLSLGYSLCSWGFFRLAVGSGRWLGYDLSDGSRFALLATSPAEMWKRWSTHLYDWTVGVVFVPMYRRLPIAIAAFTVSFFVLFLLHYSDGLTELFWYSPTGTATTSVTLKGLIYFQSLGLVIYASSIFPNIWPQEQRRSGWLGVFSVQAAMSICHLVLL